jgi:putative MATE family efflux protein
MMAGCMERGTTAMVARFTGEGDGARAGKALGQSITVSVAIGLVVSVLGVTLSRQFLEWMGTPAEVVAAGTSYLAVIFAASVPRLLFFVGAAGLRGAGDTRTPMWIMVWTNVVNVFLNYLLIYGHWGFPRLGLLGSGIATALSAVASAAAVLWLLSRSASPVHVRRRHLRPDTRMLRTMWRLSVPGLVDEVIVTVGFLVFISYIARLGTVALAAHTLAVRIESLSFMVGFGFTIACSTLVGQSLGAGRPDEAHLAFRLATRWSMACMSAIAVLLIVWGRGLLAVFGPAADVHDLAYALLIIAAVEQPLMGIGFALVGGLRGAGDTVSPMVVSFVGNVLVRVFVVYWLAFGLGWGVYGVYLGTVLDWAVRSVLCLAAFRHGRWLTVRL